MMSDDDRPRVVGMRPEATDEEVAAVLAALEVAVPRGVVADAPTEVPRWRFSGRWWTKPLPARRDRP